MRSYVFDGLIVLGLLLTLLSAFVEPRITWRVHLGWLGVSMVLLAFLMWRHPGW